MSKSYNFDWGKFVDDPAAFVSFCWPGMKLTDYQLRILRSSSNNVETFVHAANGVGKTLIVGVIALWWYATRTPARVILTSTTEQQLEKVLWNQILALVKSSSKPFPFKIQQLQLRKDLGAIDVDPRDGLFAVVPRMAESLQGFHLGKDRPRVLLLMDETSGISESIYEAGMSWADGIVAIGNPLNNDGFFFRQCKAGNQDDPAGAGALLREVIHVSALQSPNVLLGMRLRELGHKGPIKPLVDGLITYAKFVRLERELDEEQKTKRLYGKFYEGDRARLIPDSWLDHAMCSKHAERLAQVDRCPIAMGVDVAQGGRDNTCITLVDEYGIYDQIVVDYADSMKIAGLVKSLIDEYEISPNRVVIDFGGGGKAIADRLNELGYYLNCVNFSESATAKGAYVNKRAELYGELRTLLKPDPDRPPFVIPAHYHQLRTELAIMPAQYDSEGKLFLPPKSSRRKGEPSIIQMLKRSPDRADSFAMAVEGLNTVEPDYTVQGLLMCSDPDDPRGPLTEKEIEELPDYVADVYRGTMDWAEERDAEDEDDGWTEVDSLSDMADHLRSLFNDWW